ncbi:unnamed protein product [Rhizophagus irregularis]|nr:unnamed protein product [Rhizophagus irregularis]
MKQCWDADPSKRPDIVTLDNKISEINLFYQKFYSNKSYNFYIPNNIDDFDKLNNQKNSSKIIGIFKVSTEESLKGNSKNVIQETMQQQIKKYHDDIDDDEIHNNPNLHTEEQDELELPDNIDN